MYQLRKKILPNSVAIYGQGRELFGPPTYNLSCLMTVLKTYLW